MKRNLCTGVLAILLSTISFLPAQAASKVNVAVNGSYVSFPDESPYVDVQSNRTMVPARFVAEQLGLQVQWNGQADQVTIWGKDKTIVITMGQNRAQVNGKDVTFDTPALIKNNRTMVPLRFISEAFDSQIDWIAERNLVVVTTSGHSKVVPVSPPQSTTDQTTKLQRGTWIWDTTLIQTDQDNILKFAQDNHLTTIYLQIDRDIPATVYQPFIREARAKQVAVEALAGRPQWAFPDQQNQVKDFIIWVKSYQANVASEERFEGFHFDIEPYLLPEWKTDHKRMVENWMNTIRLIEKETNDSGLKMTLDVPFWLHLVNVPDSTYSMSAWVLEKVDSIVIMDYRNVALGNDGIVANANTILKEASTLKKKVLVAVETAPNSEGDFTSFYTSNIGNMNAELEVVKEKLSHFPSYTGFAIHDYKSWTELDAKSKK